MTVAVYVRVSTASQNEAGQRREIQKWLAGNGINQANTQYYVDKESGDTLDRTNFQQMQQDVWNGAVKTIVVYKIDRISRSLRDGINVLCDWCEKGIRVVSVTQQLDFSGATGQLIAAVLLAVAQMEQEVRRERQAAGIAAAKERGVYTGRKKGTFKKNPQEAILLQEKGLTQQQIARAMGVSIASVVRYLRYDTNRNARP